jgi:toxin ParE1/3/4
MTYRLSKKAYQDFLGIYGSGIEQFGLRQAERYSDDLESLFELITRNPLMARLRTELRRPVRIHPHGAHLIFYHYEEGEQILILRIRHARENWFDEPG